MIKDANFTTNKSVWKFNSFFFLIFWYLLILWDSVYFYFNAFTNLEKYWIIILNLIILSLLYYYKKEYNNIDVNTITYKYTLDEYILEIIKSFFQIITWKRKKK